MEDFVRNTRGDQNPLCICVMSWRPKFEFLERKSLLIKVQKQRMNNQGNQQITRYTLQIYYADGGGGCYHSMNQNHFNVITNVSYTERSVK